DHNYPPTHDIARTHMLKQMCPHELHEPTSRSQSAALEHSGRTSVRGQCSAKEAARVCESAIVASKLQSYRPSLLSPAQALLFQLFADPVRHEPRIPSVQCRPRLQPSRQRDTSLVARQQRDPGRRPSERKSPRQVPVFSAELQTL
ncbi:MAG: hypothetical protein ACPIOQ_56125, partial [Promethearchaeia archaeon]